MLLRSLQNISQSHIKCTENASLTHNNNNDIIIIIVAVVNDNSNLKIKKKFSFK